MGVLPWAKIYRETADLQGGKIIFKLLYRHFFPLNFIFHQSVFLPCFAFSLNVLSLLQRMNVWGQPRRYQSSIQTLLLTTLLFSLPSFVRFSGPSHNKPHPHTHQRLVLVLDSTLNCASCVLKVGHIWKHGHNKEEKQFFGRLIELCTSNPCGLLLFVTACFLHEERGWGWGGIDGAISNVKKPIAVPLSFVYEVLTLPLCTSAKHGEAPLTHRLPVFQPLSHFPSQAWIQLTEGALIS